jgi:hypothetical protein
MRPCCCGLQPLQWRLSCVAVVKTRLRSCLPACFQRISTFFALCSGAYSFCRMSMDTLCSKCRSIFSTPLRGKPASRYNIVPAEAVALHSDSIASLFALKTLPCHLCVLLWEAKHDYFELLLQRETQSDISQDPGRAEVRWRWEKSRYREGGGNLCQLHRQE